MSLITPGESIRFSGKILWHNALFTGWGFGPAHPSSEKRKERSVTYEPEYCSKKQPVVYSTINAQHFHLYFCCPLLSFPEYLLCTAGTLQFTDRNSADDFFHLLRTNSAIMGKKKRQNRKGKALCCLSSSGRYAFPLYLLHRKLFLELSLFQLFTYDFLYFRQPID